MLAARPCSHLPAGSRNSKLLAPRGHQIDTQPKTQLWQRRPWVASLLAAVILVAPAALVRFPKLPDYPAHFAAYYLIAGGAKDPLLARTYQILWQPIPNLAGEIIVPALAHVVPLVVAAKLFLGVAIVLWVLGPALIHRALYGHFGLGGLIAGAFTYNINLMWGFLNYDFGIGVAFFVFAAWIATASRRNTLHIVAFAIAAITIYFCHVFAAVVLALMLGGFEISVIVTRHEENWRRTLAVRLGTLVLVFLPVAIASSFRPRGEGESHIEFNLIDTALDRIDAILQRYFDHPAYLLLVILLVSLGVALYLKRASIDRRMKPLLLALLIGAIFAPEWAAGGWGVDLRLPGVLCGLLFASTDFRFRERELAVAEAAVLAIFVLNAAVLTGNWRRFDRQVKEFRTALTRVPLGSRLMTVLDGDDIGMRSDQPYWHLAELAIVDRKAFTPLMFTTHGQHITRVLRPYAKFAAATANEGSPPDITELDDLSNGITDGDEDIKLVFPYLMYFQCHFDEAVVIHLGDKRSAVPSMLHLRLAGTFFSLYDISHTNCPKQ